MSHSRTLVIAVVLAVLSVGVRSSQGVTHDRGRAEVPAREQLAAPAATRLPVQFERNDGQVNARVRYLTRAEGYTLLLLDHEAIVASRRGGCALRIGVVGARTDTAPAAAQRQAGSIHHVHGDDPAAWVRDVPHFAEVRYADVLPGIDQVWRKARGLAEMRFVVRPGADPRSIGLHYDGADALRISDERLVAELPGGVVQHSAPVAYQGDGAGRTSVPVRYAIDSAGDVRFVLGVHDTSRELVIDPEIEFSSYYGGSENDSCHGVAIDDSGNCYVTGGSSSSDLPTTAGAYQPTTPDSGADAYLAKFASNGSTLVYATYFGGTDGEGDGQEGRAIAVDAAGNATVAGLTSTANFPLVDPAQDEWAGRDDTFVTTFDATGSSLLFSTYLGGSLGDQVEDLTIDAGGNIYVVGSTASTDFPLQSPLQATRMGFVEDGFVARLRAGEIQFSTYLGGTDGDTVKSVAVDRSSTAPGGADFVVCGTTQSADFPTQNAHQGTRAGTAFNSEAFVTRFSSGGATLAWSTYLGGSDFDQGRGVAVDSSGAVYVTGETQSDDFLVYEDVVGVLPSPTLQPALASSPDAYAVKLSSAGELVYATYLGGNNGDAGDRIVVGAGGEAWIVGTTSSTDFPLVEALQSERRGNPDLFLSRLDTTAGSLLFSTYLGATGGSVNSARVAITKDGAVAVAGSAFSAYLTTPGSLMDTLAPGDFATGFLTKLAAPGNEPPPNTIRSFVLPKKLSVVVGAGVGKRAKKPGVRLTAFFDSGPTSVDLSDPARLTLGPRTFDIPALTPVSKGRSFRYSGQGISLDIRPSPIGSSKGKLKLTYDGDLGPEVDVNGAFAIRFENDSGVDAKGECVLSGGAFTFGREAGELIAPELSIRKAKAKLPGVGKHNFKFVAGFTTGGTSPSTAPNLHVGFGDVFAADIPSTALQLKGSNFRLGGDVAGIDAFTLTYTKERISVRGGDVDLGEVEEGPVPVLLIFAQGEDLRAVFVRMVRKGKTLKY